MKLLAIAIGAATLVYGASQMTSPTATPMSESDYEFGWKLAKGRNGEQNPAAVALYRAILGRDHAEVRKLLDSGVSPNLQLAPNRLSPLDCAIYANDRASVELLVERGADMNYISGVRAAESPLTTALVYGVPREDLSIFRYLVAKGADINLTVDNEDIAIHAATLGQPDLVNELLAKGYRRDLPELQRTLKIILVSKNVQADKDRALATIDGLLQQKQLR